MRYGCRDYDLVHVARATRIRRLLASVERGDELLPVPRSVVRFYDNIERRADNVREHRVIRRERDFMELAPYHDLGRAVADAVLHFSRRCDLPWQRQRP